MSDEWHFIIKGTNRFFVGIEHAVDGWTWSTRRLSIEPMAELEKPYRVGKSIRLRLRHRAYHIGLCRLSERPPGRELADVDIAQISTSYRGAAPEIWES